MQQLTAQNEDLHSTLETLKEELISSNREAEQASHELDIMRSRTMQENAQESLMRDRELREAQTELEQCRMEREEWEQVALQERAIVDDRTSTLEALHRDLGLEREARAREAAELESEKLNSSNLQSVLQDFQAGTELLSTYFNTVFLNPIFLSSKRPRTAAGSKRLRVSTYTSNTVSSRV